MKNVAKNAGLAAIITLLVLTVLGLCMPFVYDMNDDLYLRAFVSGAYLGQPDPHMIYMGYPLGVLLSLLYKIKRNIDWYGVFLIFCHLYCLYLCEYRILSGKKDTKKKIIAAVSVVGVFFSVWLSRTMLLTYTTAAAAVCATTIFWYASADFSKNRIWEYIILILSTALSVCIRKEMAFMMLPIAGSVFWFKNRNHGNWKCWKNWIPVAVVFSVFSALLLLDVLAYQSQGWKEYRQFNAARTGIFDYYDFPSYEENKDFYDSIGIDETIETAMEEYSLILDDRINTETFLAIEQQGKTLWNNRSFMQRAGETLRIFLQNWFSFEYFPLNYIVMLVGSSLLFIMLKQKDRVVLYWYCIAWLVIDCLWIYLCYRGRFPARIGYSMHIFAFMMEMSFLWILHKEGCLVISKVFWRGALVCILLCSIYQGTTTYQYSHNAHQKNKSYRTVLKYCEDRNTNFYFMDVFSFSLYTDNFQLFLPSNEKNYMRFGDWMSYSPLYYEKLSHNDIHKIAEDLIHRDDIYLITRDDVDIQYLKRYMKSLNPKYTYHVADVIQEDGFLFYVYKWFEADSSQAELSSERISEIIASSDTASCSNVIDDNIATGWYCDSQIEGEEVVIRLKERETITGVRLDVTDYADSPKNLKIYTSLDGNVWSEQEIENQLNMTFRFSPAECNYVKLQLGDGEDYVQWRWSIQELTLLGVEVYE